MVVIDPPTFICELSKGTLLYLIGIEENWLIQAIETDEASEKPSYKLI